MNIALKNVKIDNIFQFLFLKYIYGYKIFNITILFKTNS